jgi:predicted dehydrogenase
MDIVLVGLGRMGQTHLRAIREFLPQLRLAAIAEPRQELIVPNVELLRDTKIYSEAAEALRHPGLDGCLVVTPTDTHAAIVRDALDLGLHIFCEKPLTLKRDDSLRLGEMAENERLVLQVGFWRRFSPVFLKAKEFLRNGAIGEPILLHLTQWDIACPPSEWCDPRRSGGIFIDMAVHEFDEVEWLLDARITDVSAHALALVNKDLRAVGDVDNAIVLVGLDRDTRALVDLSRNGRYADDVRLEILGSEGALFIDTYPAPRVRIGTRGGVQNAWEAHGHDAFLSGVAGELAAFSFAATGRAALSSVPGAGESVRATTIGEAARVSAVSGSLVEVTASDYSF